MKSVAMLVDEDERERIAAEIAGRIQAGDLAAESEMVRRYGPGLSYLLRHLTGDATWAEDLLQETFAVALPRLRAGELQEAARLNAFLRGTAKNLVRGARRKEHRRARAGESPLPAASEEAPIAEVRDSAPGPLRELLLEEEIALARRLIEEVGSDRDREILYRFYVAEEGKESLCLAMGLSQQQFNLVLFRARKRFRASWEAVLEEGPEAVGGRAQWAEMGNNGK